MNIMQRLRILPVLVLVAGLALIVRVGEFAAGIEQAGTAYAQQEVSQQPPPMPSLSEMEKANTPEKEETEIAAAAEGAAESEAAPDTQGGALPEAPSAENAEPVDWKDATESDFEYSEVREDLYKDLVARREDLEKRERALATREAILKATERELDQKIREMTAVKNDIENLLEMQNQQEQERIGSLVKIYEGMKAKDAANIFNTLDMDVLIAVISRMSERKSAPILAEMSAERARSVTILLAQQKQIPDIPPQ